MSGKQQRNVEGKLITRHGTLDQRAANTGATELPLAPECAFDVVHKPSDSRPWHVVATNLETGLQRRVSRHALEFSARQRATAERLRQPNARPSVKALHKAGIDQRR